MSISERLGLLQAAQGQPAKLALATVDLAYSALSELERSAIREGLEAAAVPHWCDPPIVASLLAIHEAESVALVTRLQSLSIVEPFPARGEKVVNVHEASRLAIRKWLAAEQEERFRELSARAAALFVGDSTSSGRIEWIYHFLSADPERAATALEKLDREWSNQVQPEDRYALAAALKELEDTEMVSGRARVWVQLAIAWTRASRGEHAFLADKAAEIIKLAHISKDKRAEGDAHWLAGDAYMAQGRVEDARKAYHRNLEISRKLAKQEPSNGGWQRELAVAHALVAGVLRERGKASEAERACQEAITILRQLLQESPGHPVWVQDLGGILLQMSDMVQTRGLLTDAETLIKESLGLQESLAEKDPTNAVWQLNLALGHSRMGDVLQAQQKMAQAETAFVKARALSEHLASLDPTHAGWQLRLSVAFNRVGNLFLLQHRLSQAQEQFEKSLAITRSLTLNNPMSAVWQRELAVALSRVSDVLYAQDKFDEARVLLEESVAIHRQLTAKDPTRVEWQQDLAWACVQAGRLLLKTDRNAAGVFYDEAIAIMAALAREHGSEKIRTDKTAFEKERADVLGTARPD